METARTGNWFVENPLAISRLDKLSRNEEIQDKLAAPGCEWDLIICDEAHKMSATFSGGEISYTKRYKLGQLLSTLTRHYLLMTATPHNGKDEDFQLFMALLDGDRFEGRFRDGVHTEDVSDLMRRLVKENLYKFDGTPLFPERFAYSVPYKLSNGEAKLYSSVTNYVREEFNRLEALQNDKSAGTLGFALTTLQRRLASSPEAIYQSLSNRKEKLEGRLKEFELLKRGSIIRDFNFNLHDGFGIEDLEDMEDAPESEIEQTDREILDTTTASRSVDELRLEIKTLTELKTLANEVRLSGDDKKWQELSGLLNEVFYTRQESQESKVSMENSQYSFEPSQHQKIVIFTEFRATLSYLFQRITTLFGREDSVVVIHGDIHREQRLLAQESFRHDPNVKVLLATDAAGEGINLQRAHLMVNYDLPWNPNRIEQRFGRIHRIGQTEVCHLWNLVAEETREGDVYRTLLHKLEEERLALGGQVFDVLGKIQFEGKSLKDLLIQAIRYGEQPEVQARLHQVVENAFDREKIQNLLSDHALAQDSMDTSEVSRIREEMERAELRRLQPYYVESFFMESFKSLGGVLNQKEPRRYQVTQVPSQIRNRDRLIGIGEPVLSRYERIVFEKSLVSPQGQPIAGLVSPGHPLLNATIDITLERHRHLLRQGVMLVDDNDLSDQPRMLMYLEHSIQDGTLTRQDQHRTISKQMLYLEIDSEGNTLSRSYAPYLDYRSLKNHEPSIKNILDRTECEWINVDIESKGLEYAVSNMVPAHLEMIRSRKMELLLKTESAVKERLTKEIAYWDHRAADLREQELAGKRNARLNADGANRRADSLQGRLQKRMGEIQKEKQISALPPVVVGGALIIPIGLLNKMMGFIPPVTSPRNTQASAARARRVVMEIERSLGFDPVDRELDKLGYDIESRVTGTGKLRFIEVKGRQSGADTITVTKNEILTSLNKPEDYILAIVEFIDDFEHKVHYIREPFKRDPDFGVTSVNYNMADLIERAVVPS